MMILEDANLGGKGGGFGEGEKEEAINTGRRHSRCCNSPEEGSAAFESKLRVQIGRAFVGNVKRIKIRYLLSDVPSHMSSLSFARAMRCYINVTCRGP